MMRSALFFAALFCPAILFPGSSRTAHTYSIVARDPQTGDMGVAVQSHYFSVGSAVPWAEAGVGAVATQSMIEISYGPLGLELMRAGKSATDALKALLAADEQRETRQVAMVDSQGRVAAHTGTRCIAEAGHKLGSNYSVQANLMEKSTVWPAMANAFESSSGDLADRLIAALEAAEREGGDIRGKQSAAILVVRGKSTGRPWLDRVVDLRVEDHPEPVPELKRLVRLQRAYRHVDAGDDCSTKKDWDCATREYGEAERMAPENSEMVFWHAVALATGGHVSDALPLFSKVFAREPKWIQLVGRLPAAGLLPDDAALIRRIQAVR
jgi:uncharacterized Ntn-hydrolase superfamily protein